MQTLPGLGFSVGHVTHEDTGVTVIYCGEQGTVAGVDVRGGGPGTRETDLLEPHNTVERVHALVLAGGSAFGLAAADGVMRGLEEAGIGFPAFGEDIPGPRVPIVPGAVIFDLLAGPQRPTAEDGEAALRAALAGHDATSGSVGAGTGACAGKIRGGVGTAFVDASPFTVAAVVVANPVGQVIDAETGRLFGAPGVPAVDVEKFAAARSLAEAFTGTSRLNTTIGAVLTDAPLSKAQVKRLALAGHDGIARAVRPAHSPLDGDTLFAAASGTQPADQGIGAAELASLSAAAADAVEAAIVDAVVSATPGLGLETYSSLRAC
ncbi:P1 family peptidase [Corynebacterium sp. HMSC036D02]|uniref:P1 family peptidase n=1 Tax=Corynebacterium sp. HMSC036D02 TaxID=1715013 RepID=UPI0008A9CAC1|nr:P1 family peptidase [Corynebacterium sp. HMSC036D02]OHO64462.1 peptidase [Corynebacterium sp. HMSC036D02]